MSQVRWVKADVAADASAALPDDVDAVVSCIGSGDLLKADDDGWNGRWAWSDRSTRQNAENFEPNAQLIEAAKAAGAKRFVYIGAGSEAEMGFAGPNPGLYTGKRSASLAALDAFGDTFTYFGPHAVVESEDDWRMKLAGSGFVGGLRALNDLVGEFRTFGPDYTTKTKLAAPVAAADLALAVAAVAMGELEVEPSLRSAGMTVFTTTRETDQYEINDMLRHVDGTAAITALAARARALERAT